MSQRGAMLTGQADPSSWPASTQHTAQEELGAKCLAHHLAGGDKKTLGLPTFTWRFHVVQMADGRAAPWNLVLTVCSGFPNSLQSQFSLFQASVGEAWNV